MNESKLRDMFDMKDRVVVVTGGTRGIGRALAEGYVCAGAKVVVVGRNPESCKEAESHLRSLGGEARAFPADVGREGDAAKIVSAAVEEFGRLDVLVNNAASGGMHVPGAFTRDDWQQIFEVNVKGPVFLIHEALPHLKRSQDGAVLNILSSAGFSYAPMFSVYGSSKAALFAYTRSAAAEFAQYGIRVNAIAPGPIRTELHLSGPAWKQIKAAEATLLKRSADPDELVGPALLLTSDAGSFITGQVLMVDGGLVMAR